MQNKLFKQLSNPYFLFCFIPGFYILFGTLYALQYTLINWLSFGLLYLFVMLNQLLESKFRIGYSMTSHQERRSVFLLETLLVLIVVFFSFSYSIFAGLLLICYTTMIQCQYIFIHYKLSLFSILLVTIFKTVLMNSLSFYIHTNFIPLRLVLWVIPLLLPVLLMEVSRCHIVINKKVVTTILLLSYLVGTASMWILVDRYATILFLSVPFAFALWNNFNTRTIQLFTASYLLLHFSASLFSFFTLL